MKWVAGVTRVLIYDLKSLEKQQNSSEHSGCDSHSSPVSGDNETYNEAEGKIQNSVRSAL